MLHSENACVEAISGLMETDFAEPIHQTYFGVISALYSRSVRPTFVEVLKEGQTLGIISNPNDVERLQQISEHYIDDENIQYWIDAVKTKSSVKKAEKLIRKYDARIQEAPDSDAKDMLADIGADFSSLALSGEKDDFIEAKELATYAVDRITAKMERYRELANNNTGALPLDGVPTGYPWLDQLTLGYKPGDLFMLFAKTGQGKTAFALKTSHTVAVINKRPMLYINTEMSKDQLSFRWGAILAGVNHDRIRSGGISNEEYSMITNGFAPFYESPFYLYNAHDLTPAKFVSISRKAKLKKHVELIILDYVGRMEKIDPRNKIQEWQMLEQAVKQGKIIAQDLECAVMILGQLNEDGSLQGAKRMKNECDLMAKLGPVPQDYVEEQNGKGFYYEPWNYILDLDKNRDGQSGVKIPLYFDMEKQQIIQAKRVNGRNDFSSIERKG